MGAQRNERDRWYVGNVCRKGGCAYAYIAKESGKVVDAACDVMYSDTVANEFETHGKCGAAALSVAKPKEYLSRAERRSARVQPGVMTKEGTFIPSQVEPVTLGEHLSSLQQTGDGIIYQG